MSDPRWERLWSIFHAAVELPAAEREALLSRRCAGDADLETEVRELLRAHQSDSPLDGRPEQLFGLAAGLEGRRVGAYRLLKEIGRGGMGAVYLAERADGAFEQQVAVKFVARHRDEEARRRFVREREVLARLEHPYIARLIDGGETEDGIPYLVMEWVEGESVDRYCRQRGLALPLRLALFARICEAVHYAHQNLVVHRDIKPGNVLITRGGVPKLLDFGIAKPLDRQLTSTLTGLQMTPDYASPEQVLGESITTASDVYALGIMLHQLLVDERPFDLGEASLAEIVAAICETEPPPPSAAARGRALAERLRGDLDAIVAKAIRKEPLARYRSAQSLAEDIERHLRQEPIRARAPSRTYRLQRFIQRHKLGFVAGSAVFLALLGLTGGLLVQRQQLEQALVRAETQTERSRAAFGFLSELLLEADPEVNLGRPLTVTDVLDQGAERLSREFDDQPTLRAELANTLGRIYLHLGELDRAGPFFEQALPAADGIERARVLTGLAALAEQQNRHEDAERHQRAAIALLDNGAGAPELADARMQLAAILQSQGRLDDARAALDAALKDPAADPLQVARGRIRMGALEWGDGKIEQAAREYAAALATFDAELGPEHFETARAHYALASARHRLGDFQAAEAHYRKALAVNRALYGENHPRTGNSLSALGALLYDRGDSHAAAAVLDQALSALGAVFGDNRAPLTLALNNLALAQHDLGWFEQAEDHFRTALDINRETLGSDHWKVAGNLNNLGLLWLDREQPARARPLLEEARRIHAGLFDPGHPSRAYSDHLLGRASLQAGEVETAAALLDRALEVRRGQADGRHPTVADTLIWQARVHGARGDVTAGLTAVSEGHRIRLEALGEDDWRTAEALALTGAWRIASGDAAGGRTELERGTSAMIRLRGEDDWRARKLDGDIRVLLCGLDPRPPECAGLVQ